MTYHRDEDMVGDICSASDRIQYLDRFSGEVLQREDERRKLLLTDVHRRLEASIILVIVLINAFLFLFFLHYVVFWIVCSLLVISFYPLTSLLRALAKTIGKRRGQKEEKYVKTLQAFRMLKKSEQFYHIEWSVFFINMRSASAALVILCISNLFAAVGYLLIFRRDADAGFFIAIQFFLFFTLYTAVILLKPYTSAFEDWIRKIAASVERQKPVIWIVLLILGILGFFTALFVLAAYLFPASTAMDLLERERIGLFDFFLEFSTILVSQFVIVRYIHSLQSRKITLQVSEAIEQSVRGEVVPLIENARSGTPAGEEIGCEQFRTIMTTLLEARMFTTVVLKIFTVFPLYMFRPDLSLIMDDETLKSLRGHMRITG